MNRRETNGSLPDGWVTTTMGAVSDVIGGGTPKTTVPGNFSDGDGHPWLTPADLTGHTAKTVSHGRRFLTDQGLATSSAKYMPAGTILFSSRAPIGYVAIAANPITTNQGFRSFVPSESLDSNYAYHYLRSITELAEQLASGTTFNELSGSKAKTIPLPVPPMSEQRRIADRLDEVESHRASVSTHLQTARIGLNRLRSTVRAAACAGRLTADWRGSHKLIDWETVRLDEACASIADGDHQAPPKVPSGIPFITISAINDARLHIEQATRFVPETYYAALKPNRRPQEGDVLFSVTGSIGIPAVVDTPERFTFQRHIAILRPNTSRLVTHYLYHALGTNNVQHQALAVATGTAQLTISLGGLRAFRLPLPPIDEQHEIVRRLEAMLAIADRLADQIDQSELRLNRISRASSVKAFRGELVPTEASLAVGAAE